MSIWQRAVETYDCHSDQAGVYEIGKVPLAPISHIVKDADIEIVLDQEGNFLDATSLKSKDKSDLSQKTIIPITEDSAGRGGTTFFAHPLSDQLCYTAPCYPERYQKYADQIADWANSEFSHPKVCAVSAYIHKGTIVNDLIDCGIIETDADGVPLEKYSKNLIRWRVFGSGENDECYKDKSLFDAFCNYYLSKKSGNAKKTCMILGKDDYVVRNFPKGVLATSFNSKLISSSDNVNFTYKGRFTDAQQAATIGYEATQKAHNALTWVVANQGIFIDGRAFVCWDPSGCHVPLLESKVVKRPYEDDEEHEIKTFTTPSDYKADLQKALSGWRQHLPDQENVVISSFDSATEGRLSIVYYNELKGSDFLNRLVFWQEHCFWQNGIFGYQSPSIWEIVKCSFGTEQGGKLTVDTRVMREQTQRLFHCIIDQSPIPLDIVQALMHRASNPLAYDDSKTHNHKKVMFTACAVIYAYRTVTKKEEWKMALEKDKKDRSYQFGRLLAVMEKVERDTYDRDEKREPNAIRMQSVFCERPMYAARIIRDSLNPYFAKLSPGMRIYYNNLIGEIFGHLSEFDEKDLNRQLEDSYLLGYYLQRSELYTKKESNNEEEN